MAAADPPADVADDDGETMMMAMASNCEGGSGGGGTPATAGSFLVGMLDLPSGSVVTFDGCLRPIALKRDDFVGFSSVPMFFADGGGGGGSAVAASKRPMFHLIAVRCGGGGGPNRERQSVGVTVGFAVMASPSSNSNSPNSMCFVRRYDARTEEVSSEPVDDVTARNLLRDVDRMRQHQPHRVVDYDRLLEQGGGGGKGAWLDLTRHVSPSLLARRLGRCSVDGGWKVIPGSCDLDEDGDGGGGGLDEVGSGSAGNPRQHEQQLQRMADDDNGDDHEDGRPLSYPCVPVVVSSDSATSWGGGGPSNRSRRRCRHAGTKRWLAALAPEDRTRILSGSNPGTAALRAVLDSHYGGCEDDLLGDVQLSYVAFLHLHCYASLTYWRDLVAMVSCVEWVGVRDRAELYGNFVDVLCCQLNTVESDFFDGEGLDGGDDEMMSGGGDGDDNFLLPSLRRLASSLSRAAASGGGSGASSASDGLLRDSSAKLERVLAEKFPAHFGGADFMSSDCADGTTATTNSDSNHRCAANREEGPMQVDFPSDDDEDGPVIVPCEEIESSLARVEAAERDRAARRRPPPTAGEGELSSTSLEEAKRQFPLLFAAMAPDEDVLMTCARALDSKSDVSLVREAAAYLEQVEAKRTGGAS